MRFNATVVSETMSWSVLLVFVVEPQGGGMWFCG